MLHLLPRSTFLNVRSLYEPVYITCTSLIVISLATDNLVRLARVETIGLDDHHIYDDNLVTNSVQCAFLPLYYTATTGGQITVQLLDEYCVLGAIEL